MNITFIFLYHMWWVREKISLIIIEKNNFYKFERTVLWYPSKLCYFFSDWSETFFRFFTPSEQQNDQYFICLWFCYCVTILCVCSAKWVISPMSEYVPNSIKMDTNIPQCNTSGYFFSSKFWVLWGLANFVKWNPNHVENKLISCICSNQTVLKLYHKAMV